jgi:hypothetical protein
VLRKARGWGLSTSQRGSDGGWRKSSRSGGNTECVEVRFTDRTVHVRDSKDQDGPVMHFSGPEWRAFLAAIRWREFG